mgnify:CR=1 FL=1
MSKSLTSALATLDINTYGQTHTQGPTKRKLKKPLLGTSDTYTVRRLEKQKKMKRAKDRKEKKIRWYDGYSRQDTIISIPEYSTDSDSEL